MHNNVKLTQCITDYLKIKTRIVRILTNGIVVDRIILIIGFGK